MISLSPPEIPHDLRALMARVGPRWASDIPGNVRLMVRSFDPILARAPKGGVTVVRDVAYGDHPRQTLDVFAPARSEASPVAVFVHGGAFVDGEKNRSPEVYANVLFYLARHGIVGVNMEYRLAPECPYPAGLEDVSSVVRWVRMNVAGYRGDPRRIFLIGHSSGAAHAAAYAYGSACEASDGEPSVAGLIVISGRVRVDASPENPNARKVQAYYGTNAELYERLSPVTMVNASSVPTMIAFAEYENPLIDVYCLELAHRIAQAKRRAPRVLRLAGHNHTSIVAHINSADDLLGKEMLDFVAETAGRGAASPAGHVVEADAAATVPLEGK
jgi:acetyl esterase/lipase